MSQRSGPLSILRRGPISPRLHGTLDYPLAAILLGGPRLLDVRDDTATAVVLAVGGGATGLAVGTNWVPVDSAPPC